MVIKKIKAFIKWTFLLAAVFCLSFLIAGGANFYLSDNEMFVKVQNTTRVLSTKIGEGIDNIVGSIEPGKRADILCIGDCPRVVK